jgi:hypothetical protein
MSDAFTALAEAVGVASCHNDVMTRALISAILESERRGPPLPVFEDAAQEYADWAAFASPPEREAMFAACARELAGQPAHAVQVKRLIAACFKRLSAADRAAFLEWAGRQ